MTFLGLAYASAPLYRLACQEFGWSGTINPKAKKKLEELAAFNENRENKSMPGHNRKFLVRFDSRTGVGVCFFLCVVGNKDNIFFFHNFLFVCANTPWDFYPVQNYVVTRAGESTLAFFTAHNHDNGPVSAVSTYTVLPFKAARYFIKVQCFCFEEQRLRGHETVDMPVLFFIDPAILNDPKMTDLDEITLSYVFNASSFEDDPNQEEEDEDGNKIPALGLNVPTSGEPTWLKDVIQNNGQQPQPQIM
ncbi:component involved in heme biosynthesis [Reticulomyxa filosa]|uniref:Component involved in heme biosynthesis n=1 Tax=Reticulomyxa filosa TaxID=46433 RepID=X6N436_RETFI|nr:component involved in heme biosynthesis [Reticulomyxa filosa]|eukprot:ETO21045.1 component involved in heme biosynthesis [Reticulomyxa filosa]